MNTKPIVNLRRVLFVGDSITQHSPRVALGWYGDWGMAASSAGRDYVHVLFDKLCDAIGSASPPELCISGRIVGTETAKGRIDGHLACADRYRDHQADLVIVQLGENEADVEVTRQGFERPYEQLVRSLQGDGSPIMFCTGVWGDGENVALRNRMIQDVCRRSDAKFVPIHHLYADFAHTSATGRFDHEGVASHPGDEGHRGYADALWEAVRQGISEITDPDPG